MAANYRTVLPDPAVLQEELDKARLMLETGHAAPTQKNKQKAG